MKPRKNKLDRYFLLSWRKVWMIVVAWFSAVILHNAVYAFAMYFFNVEFEEAFFFIIAIIVIPLYVIAMLMYTLVQFIRFKLKHN